MIDQSRRPDVPEVGWYATRLVKGGPEVACRIIQAGSLWVVLVGGLPTQEEAETEPWKLRMAERVAFSRRIDEATYDAMLTAAAEAKPGEPLATPDKAVDWRSAPSLY